MKLKKYILPFGIAVLVFLVLQYALKSFVSNTNANYILSSITQGLSSLVALLFVIIFFLCQSTRRVSMLSQVLKPDGYLLLGIFMVSIVFPLIIMKIGYTKYLNILVNVSISLGVFCLASLIPFIISVNESGSYFKCYLRLKEINIQYLFDTSAIRAMSKKNLQDLYNTQNSLHVSPYPFWEILSHLEEDYKYYKTELLKFQYFRFLDDPYASLDKTFLTKNFDLQERIPNGEIIYPMIAALQNSDSVDEFYSAYIRDDKGDIHELSECATRMHDSLLREEERYVGFVAEIIELLRGGKVNLPNSAEEYHQRILELVEGRFLQYKQRGALDESLRERVVRKFYIFFSYIFHRALKYYKSNTDISEIDNNDYEDASICLHLKLQTPYCVVTGDKGMRTALMETFSLLNQLNKPQFETTLEVKDLNNFRSDCI